MAGPVRGGLGTGRPDIPGRWARKGQPGGPPFSVFEAAAAEVDKCLAFSIFQREHF